MKHPGTLRRLRDYFGYHIEYGATRQTVTNRVKRVVAETDLRKKITLHVLRHTYGTLIAARGATPQYIRQTMGTPTSRARTTTCSTRDTVECRSRGAVVAFGNKLMLVEYCLPNTASALI